MIYALGWAYEKFDVWIKAVPKRKFPAEPAGKLKQPFSTESDAELFMYLIRGIRFGSWKVRCLNRV